MNVFEAAIAFVGLMKEWFADGAGSSETKSVRNESELQHLQQTINEIQRELSEIRNPRMASEAIEQAKQQVYNEIREKPLPKQDKPAMVVIGPTSAGKTSLLNAMFNLNLKVSAMQCTQGVCRVATVGGWEIYDVFGTNPKRLYLQWDAVQGIATKHVALVCFSDAMENAIDAIDLALAAGLKVIVVRTKTDAIPDGVNEALTDIINAEAAQANRLGAHHYVAVSALHDPRSVADLKQKLGML
jgi:GTP-binding protein EngB required for normal cell division